MIKAVILDCFGALASDGWLPFRETHSSHDPVLLEKAISSNKKVDAGLLKYDAFIKEVAGLAGVTENDARKDIENNIPNNELLEYIKTELKPKYKIGMLSNVGKNLLDEIFTKDQVDMFDATALSYEMGIIKPDPLAYETIAQRLGCIVNECVFIDDQPKCCEGASRVGMQVIQYMNFNQMKADLNEILK